MPILHWLMIKKNVKQKKILSGGFKSKFWVEEKKLKYCSHKIWAGV